MRKRYWFWGLQILALAALSMLMTSSSNAQGLGRKVLPTLSLVKVFQTATSDITSRDTIYVAEPGPGEKRYLALPIYVKNCLDSLYDPITGLTAEPLYSFKFKLQYNRELMRAVGIQKRGALPQDTVVLAKNFNFSWDIDLDPNYKLSTVGGPSANGERIMVTASSALPLPMSPRNNPTFTGCQFRDTAVLCYVLFEVIGQHTGGPAGVNRDQLILSRDSISWNEYEPARVTPQMVASRFETVQAGVAPSPVFPIQYPNNYGSTVIQITPRPRIDLLPPSQVVKIDSDNSDYELVTRMQTYYGNVNRIFRNILLVNGVPNSELRNLAVESDQAWLRIDTNAPNIPPGVGQGGEVGERGLFIRNVGGQLNFNIVANPAMIPTTDRQDYPTPGIYTGYVTIRSVDAVNSAVRLKVVLLVTRNPLEAGLDSTTEATNPLGIQLLFRNSAASPDTTYLTFGTGVAASDNVDTLFGEAQALLPPDSTEFFARFFPPSVVDADPTFRGLIDTRNVTPPATNNETSLDIRNFRTNTTIIYCVRFSAGSPLDYPVVIEYDTRNFPSGSQAYLRDNQNGAFLSIDMRNATSIGGFRRSITITDARVTGFCIEYTVPSVTQFPEINRGWNLVSLPVSPSNAKAEVIFPNIASGKPLQFTQNQYIDADSLEVGRGYFVKYGATVDRTIAGTQVREIHELRTPYRVRLFEGWNTVGALSLMSTTEYVSFGPIPGISSPQLISEVYRYLTDRGYEQTSIIAPGFGYWMKIDRDGYYRLAPAPNAKVAVSNDAYRTLNRLSISDNSQKIGTVYFGLDNGSINTARYELPPVPARDMFDVRFSNNGFVSTANDMNSDHVVRFQGTEYPVVLSVSNPDANYVVTDAVTGMVLGTFTRGQAGAVRITNTMTKSVKITTMASGSLELGSAYPNPTSGNVSFDIVSAKDEVVNVTLFNSLGSAVKTLFNDRVAGRQTVTFSTAGLPAGVYHYKMTSASGSQLRQVVISK